MSAPRYWGTPPALLARLAQEFGPFDCDPCPNPRPAGYDGLREPWGICNYVNPPFADVGAWVRRAIYEAEDGRESLLILPITHWTNVLLTAGAALYPLGRVKWCELESGIPGGKPGLSGAFHLDPIRMLRARELFRRRDVNAPGSLFLA